MRIRAWFLALAALLMLILAACGGGGGAPAATTAPTQPPAPAGNPEEGQEVFLNVGGCGACHTIEGVEGANGQVGPNLTHIATDAVELAEEAGDPSAEAFIRHSILDPNAYIAQNCPTGPCTPGTMPQNFKDQLTEKQLNDVVAFLMQQK